MRTGGTVAGVDMADRALHRHRVDMGAAENVDLKPIRVKFPECFASQPV